MKPRAIIRSLGNLSREFFTPLDIQKLTGSANRDYIYLMLLRLEKEGEIKRIGRGLYVLSNRRYDPLNVALALNRPCYVSFDTVLFNAGLLSQGGYTVTLATLKRSAEREIAGVNYQYIKLPPALFWGFNNDFRAVPEKALIDYCYLVSEGKRDPSLSTWSLEKINLKMLDKMMDKAEKAGIDIRQSVNSLFTPSVATKNNLRPR